MTKRLEALVGSPARVKRGKAAMPICILKVYEAGIANSWSWEAWVDAVSATAFSVELIPVLDEGDDAELTSYSLASFSTGRELFEFLNTSWLAEHEEPLSAADWQDVEKALLPINPAMAKQLCEASQPRDQSDEDAPDEQQRWIARASWDRKKPPGGGGAMWAGIAQQQLAQAALTHFVQSYFEAHQNLPCGPHRVRVTFGRLQDGADCEPRQGASHGAVFDELVLFPAGDTI